MNIIYRVRILFIVAAVAMLLCYPFFADIIPESPLVTYAGILGLVVLAALTTVRDRVLLVLDSIIAAGGVLAFEIYAVQAVRGSFGWFAAVNQILALIFLVALYFGVSGRKLAGSLGEFGEA